MADHHERRRGRALPRRAKHNCSLACCELRRLRLRADLSQRALSVLLVNGGLLCRAGDATIRRWEGGRLARKPPAFQRMVLEAARAAGRAALDVHRNRPPVRGASRQQRERGGR